MPLPGGTLRARRGKGVEAPFTRNSLEIPGSAIVERQAGPGDEILDCARDEYLVWLRRRGDARPDRDGDPGDLALCDLALTCVKARSDADAERLDGRCDRLGAVNSARRPVEASEESVAGGVHLDAAESGQLPPDRAVVLFEELAPAPIAQLGHLLRRADDVREEHGCQNRRRFRPFR